MHVLFVCTGNICRSPTAERLTCAFAAEHGLGLNASSAGTRAVIGYGMEPTAAEVLRSMGGNPEGFRARQLSPAIVGDADLILTMTTRHRDRVLAESPQAMRRTFTLLEAGRLLAVPVGADTVAQRLAQAREQQYLGRSLSYTAGDCSGATRQSTVTATLTNNAPTQGLPPYVTIGPTGPPGINQADVSLYATAGAQLKGVTVNGAAVTAATATERGHPVFTAKLVNVLPGASTVVTFTLVEPTAAGAAQVPVQPIVLPMQVNTAVPVCQK